MPPTPFERARPDLPSLIGIAALAYVVAVALHEHGGHAAACVLLGSHPTELGAFFINCEDTLLTSAARRLVEVAGPAMSLLTGVVSLWLLRLVPESAPRGFFFLWLLESIGLMSATGYLLFSGVSGLGDLGTGPEGALQGARPEWFWRVLLSLAGFLAYRRVVMFSARLISLRLQGDETERVRSGARMARISYITGGIVYAAIGLLNPYGALIIFESVLPSSLGGTSGLIWMRRWLARVPASSQAGLDFARSYGWIGVATATVVGYALIFGAR